MASYALIDTHAHLYDEQSWPNIDQIIQSANDSAISHIMMPNVDATTIERMHTVESTYPHTYAMMGLHPCHVFADWAEQMKTIETWLGTRDYIGIGETGIDLHWDKTYYPEQRLAFQWQIDMARSLHKPIIIHSRESTEICIEMIKASQNGHLTGIFHCFSGSLEQAKRIKDLGFHIGIGGVVTYKNTNLRDILAANGLDNVVLETDTPYLPPVPHRGKPNQPAYLTYIAQTIADSLGLTIDEVANITTANARAVYQMK